MNEMAISEFRARCLELLKDLREPITITVRGRPVAQVVPARADAPRRQLGTGRRGAVVLGDVVGPSGEWNAWS